MNQLRQSLSKPDHPYSKFGTGNLETLKTIPTQNGIDIRDELIKFHDKYYSTNIMTLCILGIEPLDTLQSYVEDMFSEVKNKKVGKITFEPRPYSDESLGDITFVVPVQDIHSIELVFQFPDYRGKYESNPCNQIIHLLVHEGSGLMSELKSKGWCNSRDFDSAYRVRGFQLFNLLLNLTEEGIEHINEMVKLIFQFFTFLRKETVQKWIHDELCELKKIEFTYKDKEEAITYVSEIAGNMQIYNMEHVVVGKHFIKKFEPDLIQQVLNHLKPEFVKIFAVSKKFQGTDKKEK